MTLLQKALAIDSPKSSVALNDGDKELREKCELMLAYREGKVFYTQVAQACGIPAKAVSTLCYNVLMMGVRHGICKIEMVPEKQ